MTAREATEPIALGATDIRISPMGIGTWAWGDRFYWGYGRSYTEADIQAAFQASLEAGITVFDSAEVYGFGQSERLLGQFVRAADQPVVVASKFMPLPWRLRRGSLLRALRGSLRRLGMERMDLYQIHWPFPPVAIERWMDALAQAVEEGLVGAVGVSNYNLDQTRRAHAALAKHGVPLASNQVEYSLLQRGPERTGLLDACHELDITLIAYSPLAQGLLTGKYKPGSPPPGLRRRRTGKDRLVQIEPLIALLWEIGGAHGDKTPSQVALNWLICKGTLPIPGAKNGRQAQDNAGALGWRLTDEQVAALDAASDKI